MTAQQNKAWNDEDDLVLRDLADEGVSAAIIARRLERTQAAVRSRAQRLRIKVVKE